MHQLGADVDALDALTRTFDHESHKLITSMNAINATLHSTWWAGVNATRFEGDWRRQHATSLRSVAQLLTDASQTLRTQSRQQRTVSDTELTAIVFGGAFIASLHAIQQFALDGISTSGSTGWTGGLIQRHGEIGTDRSGASGSVDVLTAGIAATGAISMGLNGFEASGSASARADLLRIQGEAHAEQGTATAGTSESASIDASVGAHADVNASEHIGFDGVDAHGDAGAFVGGEAKGDTSISGHWGPFHAKASAEGSVSYGAGVKAGGSFKIGWHGIKIGGKVGATLGLGASGGGSLELKW